jgi:hypothetical protein
VSEDLIDEMITFVRLQLDEDEQKALAIDAKEWAEDSSWFKDMLDPLPSQRRERPGWLPMITVEDVRHIARHDPARVLREVEAKRRSWMTMRHGRVAADALIGSLARDCQSPGPCGSCDDLADLLGQARV